MQEEDRMTHISGYAGFPAALNGVNAAKEVFTKIDNQGVWINAEALV